MPDYYRLPAARGTERTTRPGCLTRGCRATGSAIPTPGLTAQRGLRFCLHIPERGYLLPPPFITAPGLPPFAAPQLPYRTRGYTGLRYALAAPAYQVIVLDALVLLAARPILCCDWTQLRIAWTWMPAADAASSLWQPFHTVSSMRPTPFGSRYGFADGPPRG